ncbi:MAG: anti-sigma F factor [Desulfovibrio sp.]|nr:anti-sigma F factor [Desulfovibrio sp.]
MINEMRLDFSACPENEAFARTVIAAFLLPLNPTLEEMGDVKTSVSEAVTNAIVHGYGGRGGTVRMRSDIRDTGEITVDVVDNGCGIDDVAKAREPFFTTGPEGERSGMGFTVMESFMDSVEVASEKGVGTTVRMRKRIARRGPDARES